MAARRVLSNIIRVRGRDVLYFAHSGFDTSNRISQFWEGYLKDKKMDKPLSALKDELFDYAMRVDSKMNAQLFGSKDWDGALYKTKELAATYLSEDEAAAAELTEATSKEIDEPEPTDRLQPMKCAKQGPFQGKFDHGGTVNIMDGMPDGIKIEVDERKVMNHLARVLSGSGPKF